MALCQKVGRTEHLDLEFVDRRGLFTALRATASASAQEESAGTHSRRLDLRKVDLEGLVLVREPVLFARHFRTARRGGHRAYRAVSKRYRNALPPANSHGVSVFTLTRQSKLSLGLYTCRLLTVSF